MTFQKFPNIPPISIILK